ncbi:MAG: hypothetical protein OHK0046_21390 [Anaerolineae bacterium]
MADQEFIIAPPTVKVSFDILPIKLAFNSLALLNQVEELSGFTDWAERTYNALTPERRHLNKMVFYVLTKGISEYPDTLKTFSEYLEWFAKVDPVVFQQSIFLSLNEQCAEAPVEFDQTITPAQLMADKALFMHVIESMYTAWGKWEPEERTIYADSWDLLQSPQLAHARTVEHMTYMWDKHLRDDWNRNLPMLEDCVSAFRQLNFSGMTTLEAVKAVTGRDMGDYWKNLKPVEKVVFLPSPHVGPYNAVFTTDDTLYVVFGARMPEGVDAKSAALSRSEMLIRLSALADDTRLIILEILTQHDELCAQDIINMLNLSQSSASRHLRQLTATGFLTERRRDVAKCYSLNTERIDSTLTALKHFMKR